VRPPCGHGAPHTVLLQQLPYAAFERDALLRTAEVALTVTNRSHLYTWLRLHLHRFVAHDMALCHLPQSATHDQMHVFHSVPLPPSLLEGLLGSSQRFLSTLRQAWIANQRQPTFVELSSHASQWRDIPEARQLQHHGITRLLVHGVDSQARLRSESLFAFCTTLRDQDQVMAAGLALWMPYLHAAAMRALTPSPANTDGQGPPGSPLTLREAEVLQAVRNAWRTDEIAEQLGISPLTVKNHLRKIMAKLGARSRLHAVAEALSRQIIS
jgi:DNA-binding CsgD family transcriptional regulator